MELIVWVLGAALTICVIVISWVATNLVAIKVYMAEIAKDVSSLIKSRDAYDTKFSDLETDVNKINNELVRIDGELRNIHDRLARA